ncbi:DNA repair protein XRCC4 [Nasonia vitripennis]|uniref:Uncharacterized protein n=1 Tax=Nasonia vitripennis TaxID=7425 RepID=A0A7M7IU29_NASVI|nr:DNA repair protein XRCC4 [Nasonia vitripennis]
MSKITTIRAVNKSVDSGKEELVISTEWSDDKVKIIILRDSNTPLVGEAQFDDFMKYAKSFDKPLEQYIDELKNYLSHKNVDVEFYLKDEKFFWKKKKWALGQITVKAVTDAGVIAAYTMRLGEDYASSKVNESRLEKDNEDLRNANSELIDQLNVMVTLKNKVETALYKKCTLLINTKKEKIRQLKSKVKVMNSNNRVYDAPTDESEDELEPCTDSKSDSINRPYKRLLDENIDTKEEKRIKTKSNVEYEKSKNKIDKIASTSKEETSLHEDEETPDFISDESLCEMELKLEDERVEEAVINQEQSSEEMF